MPPRSATKHDVALAEVARKASREVIIARGVVVVAGIAAAALPIGALRGVVRPLAGHTTDVHINIVVSVTIAISIVVNLLQAAKGRSQRREIRRQRELIAELERGGP